MRGHNICFYKEILKIIPITSSYLEHWCVYIGYFDLYCSHVRGADQQEKLVYQIIKDAGNKGIYK